MARQRLDRSAHSTLAVCSCGWRDLTTGGDLAAWTLAADHARSAHGDASQSGRALDAARRRTARGRTHAHAA
jgi:hypothetical protein